MGVRLFTQTTTLAAGASCGFDADAYFAILATSGALTLKARGTNDFGASGSILPGRVTIAGDVAADGRRSRIGQLIIQNDTAGAVTFTVATSSGEIIDVRGSGETGLATDVEGPAAEGAAPSGNPLRVAGSDGAALRTLRTDTTGRAIMVGPVASGSAVGGNPVLQGGSDGTNVRNIRTDSVGNLVSVGAVAHGSAIGTTAPVMQGGSDGTNIRRVLVDLAGSPTIGNSAKRTYHQTVRGVAAASANYVLFAINAGASGIVRLRRIWILNPGMITAPALLQLELIRITAAASAGTTVTPPPAEAADAAFSGIMRTTNPTITAGTSLMSVDLWVPGAVGPFAPQLIIDQDLVAKDLTIAAGVTNGLALRAVNGGAGAASLSLRLTFTEE